MPSLDQSWIRKLLLLFLFSHRLNLVSLFFGLPQMRLEEDELSLSCLSLGWFFWFIRWPACYRLVAWWLKNSFWRHCVKIYWIEYSSERLDYFWVLNLSMIFLLNDVELMLFFFSLCDCFSIISIQSTSNQDTTESSEVLIVYYQIYSSLHSLYK